MSKNRLPNLLFLKIRWQKERSWSYCFWENMKNCMKWEKQTRHTTLTFFMLGSRHFLTDSAPIFDRFHKDHDAQTVKKFVSICSNNRNNLRLQTANYASRRTLRGEYFSTSHHITSWTAPFLCLWMMPQMFLRRAYIGIAYAPLCKWLKTPPSLSSPWNVQIY